MNQRRALILSMLALAAMTVGGTAAQAADAYPSKPIKLVVPFPPGGPTDIMGRVAAKIIGDKLKQTVKVKNGIASEDAKKNTRLIKDSKMKVQASIQGDAVRISGAKRDDLQAAMALLRKDMTDIPLSFDNFRD